MNKPSKHIRGSMKFLLSCLFTLGALIGYSDQTEQTQGHTADVFEELSTSPAQLDLATTSYETAFIRMLFVLVGIISFAGLAVILLKKYAATRMQQSNHCRNIKVLEKRAISPKTILYLVEIGGKKMLLGESQLELRNLSHLEWIESEKKGL